ncbi:hypothetical protein [Calidifontibacter terrae]
MIDGKGSFTGGGSTDRGIWVFVADPAATITGAAIIFYLNKSSFSFTNGSGAGWSNLVRSTVDDISSPASGFYAYKTTYSGTWTYNSTYKAWVANGQPYWSATIPGGSCSSVTAYARRSVTTNGKTVEFVRGPSSL